MHTFHNHSTVADAAAAATATAIDETLRVSWLKIATDPSGCVSHRSSSLCVVCIMIMGYFLFHHKRATNREREASRLREIRISHIPLIRNLQLMILRRNPPCTTHELKVIGVVPKQGLHSFTSGIDHREPHHDLLLLLLLQPLLLLLLLLLLTRRPLLIHYPEVQ